MDGNSGLLRSIIRGCPGWTTLDVLDDDVRYRTRRHLFMGCELQTDVVYGDGLRSVCLLANRRWAVDYVFEEATGHASVREYSPGGGVRVLAGLHEVPAQERAMLSVVHPYMVKLGLVAAVLPIVSPPPPRRPPRPPPRVN